VYNRALFADPNVRTRYRRATGRELRVPETWEEFRHVAAAATDRSAGTFGVVLQGAAGWLYYEWSNFAFGLGGGVMSKQYGWQGDEATPLLVDAPETVAATEFYLRLRPYNAGDYFSTGQTEQRAIMLAGRTAMAIMWSDIAIPLAQGADSTRFGFAPIPGDVSMIAGGSFFVNRSTRNRAGVGALLGYLMRSETQARLLGLGLSSPSRAAYEAPENASLPFASALRQSLERGVYMLEAGPDAVAIQQILEEYLQRAWRGDTDVQTALRLAREQIGAARTEILREVAR